MSRNGNEAAPRRTAGLDVEPEDARRGFISTPPADEREAMADRDMADAERAVVLGGATEEQRARVQAISEARTHEERRRLWIRSGS